MGSFEFSHALLAAFVRLVFCPAVIQALPQPDLLKYLARVLAIGTGDAPLVFATTLALNSADTGRSDGDPDFESFSSSSSSFSSRSEVKIDKSSRSKSQKNGNGQRQNTGKPYAILYLVSHLTSVWTADPKLLLPFFPALVTLLLLRERKGDDSAQPNAVGNEEVGTWVAETAQTTATRLPRILILQFLENLRESALVDAVARSNARKEEEQNQKEKEIEKEKEKQKQSGVPENLVNVAAGAGAGTGADSGAGTGVGPEAHLSELHTAIFYECEVLFARLVLLNECPELRYPAMVGTAPFSAKTKLWQALCVLGHFVRRPALDASLASLVMTEVARADRDCLAALLGPVNISRSARRGKGGSGAGAGASAGQAPTAQTPTQTAVPPSLALALFCASEQRCAFGVRVFMEIALSAQLVRHARLFLPLLLSRLQTFEHHPQVLASFFIALGHIVLNNERKTTKVPVQIPAGMATGPSPGQGGGEIEDEDDDSPSEKQAFLGSLLVHDRFNYLFLLPSGPGEPPRLRGRLMPAAEGQQAVTRPASDKVLMVPPGASAAQQLLEVLLPWVTCGPGLPRAVAQLVTYRLIRSFVSTSPLRTQPKDFAGLAREDDAVVPDPTSLLAPFEPLRPRGSEKQNQGGPISDDASASASASTADLETVYTDKDGGLDITSAALARRRARQQSSMSECRFWQRRATESHYRSLYRMMTGCGELCKLRVKQEAFFEEYALHSKTMVSGLLSVPVSAAQPNDPDLVPRHLLEIVTDYFRESRLAGLNADEEEARAGKDLFEAHTRACVNAARDSEEEAHAIADFEAALLGPQANGSAHAQGPGGALHAPLQAKILPFDALQLALAQGESARALNGSQRPRQPLTVCASLVGKPTNLAGIARTCEVFAVRGMTVSDMRVCDSEAFQAIAVTADRWLPIEQVSADEADGYSSLARWLRSRRAAGEIVLALEQTDTSVLLGAEETGGLSSSAALSNALANCGFTGNRHSHSHGTGLILLLGREKEGIPPTLLREVDVCLEIPQYGVIRSLNVHVSAALAVWEITKMHKSRPGEMA
jgi:tRNA G18 (ribose-2'-O)-methylase SpoU